MKYGKNNFINYHVNDKKFDLETYKTFELLKEVEDGYVFTDIAIYILKRIYQIN